MRSIPACPWGSKADPLVRQALSKFNITRLTNLTNSASTSPLSAGSVETAIADGIATVRFGHPKSNSLPGALLIRLAEAIQEMGTEGRARVIVLRSEGSGPFCAGASFDEFRAIRDEAAGRTFFSGFAHVILAMIGAPKFILTRVQGKTAGGGVGLVAASDYALATTAADVKLSEIAVGIGPFVVGPVIEKKIGLAAFSALAVEGSWRSAAWAERAGLYAEVLENEAALDARVGELAARFAAYHPEAVRRLKAICWAGTEHWPDLLAERAGISGKLVLSDYTRQALERAPQRTR
ncbi:MAG: enoyl-CoA hydratase/isomerase family protein [Gemmatimonadales bacterium]